VPSTIVCLSQLTHALQEATGLLIVLKTETSTLSLVALFAAREGKLGVVMPQVTVASKWVPHGTTLLDKA
jgi:hypothetical protein